MPDSETIADEQDLFAMEGPTTPDDDESFGPEPDDPRVAGAFGDPYDVPDFDPANEERDICSEVSC